MAPRFDFVRCREPIGTDDIEVHCDADEAVQGDVMFGVSEEVEYGYLQIDEYRCYKGDSDEPKVKRWVSLPRGTRVHTYDKFNDAYSCAGLASIAPKGTSPDSCSPSFDREGTTSTLASSSDRTVRFRDGLSPGSQEEPAEPGSMHKANTLLADWAFIDRDICGVSIQEYDPDSEAKDFWSSPYGLTSMMERQHVASLNTIKQQMAALCAESVENTKREERQLDKALLMAGVHVNLIHETDAFEPLVTVVSV